MSVSELILNTDDYCVLKGDLVDKILLSSNPDAALLYLYMSRAKKSFAPANAMKHLNFSKDRYDHAVYDLMTMQVVKEKNKDVAKATVFTEKPKYTNAQLREARVDKRFNAVCDFCETILEKPLTAGYLKSLLYIYDRLKLPAEVIIELLTYLKSKSLNAPRVLDIEREAHDWLDMGIATHVDATNYISSKYAQKTLISDILPMLNIENREILPSEEKHLINFINYGFTPDVINLAIERMNNQIEQFSFKYLNGILMSFREKNLFTVAEILEKDPEFTKNTKNIVPKVERTGDLEPWEIEIINDFRKG